MEMMTANILLSVCCIVLCITIFALQRSFSKERENYINRIMAKSNTEYISMKHATENPKQTMKNTMTNEDILGDDYRHFNGKLN